MKIILNTRDPGKVSGKPKVPGQYFENHCSKLITSVFSLCSRSSLVLLVCLLQHSLGSMHACPCWVTWGLEHGQPLSLTLPLGSRWEAATAVVQWVARVLHSVQETREVLCVLDPASREFASSALRRSYNLNELPPLIFKGKKKNIHISLANWEAKYIPFSLGEGRDE